MGLTELVIGNPAYAPSKIFLQNAQQNMDHNGIVNLAQVEKVKPWVLFTEPGKPAAKKQI